MQPAPRLEMLASFPVSARQQCGLVGRGGRSEGDRAGRGPKLRYGRRHRRCRSRRKPPPAPRHGFAPPFTRRQEKLEDEIQALEYHLEKLSREMTDASVADDLDAVHELAAGYKASDEKLKALWEDWTRVSESLEQ